MRLRARFGRDELMIDTFNDPALPPPNLGSTVKVHFAPADVLCLGAEAGAPGTVARPSAPVTGLRMPLAV